MRTTIFICLGILTYIMFGCSKPRTSETFVLVDTTDNHIPLPEIAEVKKSLAVTDDMWNGSKFSLETISDVSYNGVHECYLKPQSQLLGNLIERKKQVESFLHCFESAWDGLNKPGHRDHSSVYLPLVRALEQLSKSSSSSKSLLVFSDLEEHSSLFSVHNRKDFALLEQDPAAVLSRLASKNPLPNSLAGVSVSFIYHPKDQVDDLKFSLMAEMFENALQDRGATVTIGGSFQMADAD